MANFILQPEILIMRAFSEQPETFGTYYGSILSFQMTM